MWVAVLKIAVKVKKNITPSEIIRFFSTRYDSIRIDEMIIVWKIENISAYNTTFQSVDFETFFVIKNKGIPRESKKTLTIKKILI